MATYYKYAERNAASQVDWSAIGASISKTLTDEVDRREKAKQEITDASNKYAETLSNAPLGESQDLNDYTLDFASNAEQFRLMQDRLLRSGQLKLRDYNIGRQNLTAGSNQMFNLAKEYQSEYAAKMERMRNEESQDLESHLMGTVEGFSNFTQTGAYIDPNTGKVSVGKKIQKTMPDGTIVYQMSDNPNDFASINSLRNRLKNQYDRFDVDAALKKDVDNLGTRIEVMMKGGVKTLEDAKQDVNYEKTRDTFIDSYLTNPDNITSILTNYLGAVIDEDGMPGESFTFTDDKTEAESSDRFILLKTNENTGRIEGDFSTKNGEKQLEMVKKALRTQFDSMIDVKETAMPIDKPRQLSYTERRRGSQVKSVIDNISKLWYGNEKEIEAASRSLTSLVPAIVGIDVQDNEVIIEKIDKDGTVTQKGKGARYKTSYPRETFDLFIESISAELGGEVNSAEAIKIARRSLPKGREEKGDTGAFDIPKQKSLAQNFSDYITQYFTTTSPLNEDEDEAESQVRAFLLPFGDFTVDHTNFDGRDKLKISLGEGSRKIQTTIDLSRNDRVGQLKSFLVNNLAFFQEAARLQENEMIEKLAASPEQQISKVNYAEK